MQKSLLGNNYLFNYVFSEMDLGVMQPFNGFRYFLCLTDVYSSKIWCVALRKKSGPVVGRALQHLFNQIKSPISLIQADQGKQLFNLLQKF
jgi:hypothetical protein